MSASKPAAAVRSSHEGDKIVVDESKCNFCGRCVKACPTEAWDTVHGYIVSFGGLFGNSIHKGEPIIPFIADKEKLLKVCDATVQFFDDNAKAGERFQFTLEPGRQRKIRREDLGGLQWLNFILTTQ